MNKENLQESVDKLFEEIEAHTEEMLKGRKSKKIEKSDEEKEDLKPSDIADVEDNDDNEKKEEKEDKEDAPKEEEPKEEKEDNKEESKEEPKEEPEEKEDAPKEEPEEKEEEDKEDEEDEDEEDVEKSKVKKSLVDINDIEDLLTEFTFANARMLEDINMNIEKSIDINDQKSFAINEQIEFLIDSQSDLVNLVKSQGETIQRLEAKITELETAQDLSKSQKLEELETRQEDVIKSLEARIDELEHKPVGRKAQVDVFEKSFNRSAGISEQKPTLSKAQVLDKMTNMLMNGVAGITVEDVISYESTGNMSKSVKDLVFNN